MASKFPETEEGGDSSRGHDETIYLSGLPEGQTFIPECQVIYEGDSLETYFKDCIKNPGHPNFYPVSEFQDHLLPELKSQDYIDLIQRRIDQTVRVRVAYTSLDRPDFFSESKAPYPYSKYKGNHRVVRYGTGSINRLLTPEPVTDRPCPCRQCKTSIEPPKMVHCFISVHTSTYNVFDDSEAERSTFDCFYDSEEEEGKYRLFGIHLNDKGTTQIQRYQSDFCEVVCVAHDIETIKKISDCIFYSRLPNGIQNISAIADPPAQVIVSHPHGCSKRITFGKIDYLTVPLKPNYKTNTPTRLRCGLKCRLNNSKSGGNKSQELKSKTEEDEVQRVTTSHLLKADDPAEESAKGFDFETSWTNLVGVVDKMIKSDSLFVSDEFIKTYLDDNNVPPRHGKDEEDMNKEDSVQKEANPVEWLVDYSKFVSKDFQVHFQPIREGYMRNKDSSSFQSQHHNTCMSLTKDAFGFSDDYVNHIKTIAPSRELINLDGPLSDDRVQKISENFEQFLKLETSGPDLEDRIKAQNKFRDDMAMFCDKRFPNDKYSQNSLSLICGEEDNSDFRNIFGPFVSERFITNIFDSLCNVLNPPVITGLSSYAEFEVIDLPSDMTFTLPLEADYAMRYHHGRPGWIQFPPGTKFTTKDSKEIPIPDGSELQIPFFFPEHVSASYSIDTCPGSSGAVVHSDLIQCTQMSRFLHSGHRGEDKINLSGVQENAFFAKTSNLFPVLATTCASDIKSLLNDIFQF